MQGIKITIYSAKYGCFFGGDGREIISVTQLLHFMLSQTFWLQNSTMPVCRCACFSSIVTASAIIKCIKYTSYSSNTVMGEELAMAGSEAGI